MRALILLLAASSANAYAGQPDLPYKFEARVAEQVRVMPVVQAHDGVFIRRDDYLVQQVGAERMNTRKRRIAELSLVPDAVALALPGAVHADLVGAWHGHFRPGTLPVGARARLTGAIRRGADLDRVLGEVARGVRSEATLITWVTELHADPLSALGFPGEVVQSGTGPVMVDFSDEAMRVRAEVGVALVSRDGEVILRYTDTYETVLTERRGPSQVGRDLAQALSADVAKMWPCRSELEPPRAPSKSIEPKRRAPSIGVMAVSDVSLREPLW